MHIMPASNEQEFDTAMAALVQLRAGGLVIGPDPLIHTLHRLWSASYDDGLNPLLARDQSIWRRLARRSR